MLPIPTNVPVTTNILRASYEQKHFSFGNPSGRIRICLVGSCRIVPILNGLRAYNSISGNPLELLCFNPVEMRTPIDADAGECATALLRDYRIGDVDFLVSEHTVNCGVLNTAPTAQPNIFDALGCSPKMHIRLPNWNNMHIFDLETAMWDSDYAAMSREQRVHELRERTIPHKDRFLRYCRQSSFPEIGDWVETQWFTTRMGWSSNHPTLPLVWRLFNGVFGQIGIPVTQELAEHPFCARDTYAPTGIQLTEVDYEANHWKF